jgi:hypothetical protein
MLGEHADVRVGTDALEGSEVFAEGLELPARAREQRAQVHALDHREVAHHRFAQRRGARRDAEAAVAEDGGGDAERHGRRKRGVPGNLRVVVRMHVDDARHQAKAARVHGGRGALAGRAERHDLAVSYTDVGLFRGAAGAVHDGRPAYQKFKHFPVVAR